ncbi:hypothetical protein [Bacillus sp. MUM 13]|uniref:hypothetical protein n=1 Tax=Bacillus sp. MUM 13 TaxID=1678001 RepID=UPI0008F57637|nr:hypothetical protein [Bacillus sp. MUM 13]OIK14626.1 hypothetical protein BIV59_02405 [Bacillus sp. MUM 13]
MKRVYFEPSAKYYDESIIKIDEQICALLKRRREQSNSNPGFPGSGLLKNWAREYGLYEDLLRGLFSMLRDEETFRPIVEPNQYRKLLPVLKLVEKENNVYSVTFIKQYDNASVVNLNIDREIPSGPDERENRFHGFWELKISGDYYCRMTGGGGSDGHISYQFIVSPPLPDNLSGLELVFSENPNPFFDKRSGQEIAVLLD